LRVKTDKREVTYARLCKYAAQGVNCHYGDFCRYAHTFAEVEAARRKREPTSASTIAVPPSRDVEVAAVVEEAGLEEKWVRHFLVHELDRQALTFCSDHDFDLLGLPLGARVKLRTWAERERTKPDFYYDFLPLPYTQ